MAIIDDVMIGLFELSPGNDPQLSFAKCFATEEILNIELIGPMKEMFEVNIGTNAMFSMRKFGQILTLSWRNQSR